MSSKQNLTPKKIKCTIYDNLPNQHNKQENTKQKAALSSHQSEHSQGSHSIPKACKPT